MITIIKYGQNLIKLLHFNSVVAITILLHYDCLIRIQDAFTSLLLRVILIVSACFYMDMSCFGPVQPSISTPRKKVLPDYFFPSEKVLPKYLLPREKMLPYPEILAACFLQYFTGSVFFPGKIYSLRNHSTAHWNFECFDNTIDC